MDTRPKFSIFQKTVNYIGVCVKYHFSIKTIFQWLVIVQIAIVLMSCTGKSRLEQALRLAGGNRPEMEKVLSHYSQNSADSLKYRAAIFLIENMAMHYQHTENEELYTLLDSLNLSDLPTNEVFSQFDSLKKEVRTSPPATLHDIQTLSSAFLIRHIDAIFALWEQTTWKNQIGFGDFCEYILPYTVAREKREFWVDYYRDKYLPYIKQYLHPDASGINLVDLCNSLNDSLITTQKITLYTKALISYPPIMNDHIRGSFCDDYVSRTIYLMRSLGIPAGRDFSPQWLSYHLPHSWNTLLSNGKHYPFLGFEVTAGQWKIDEEFHACPKVYRNTYAIQHNPLLTTGEPVPDFFRRNDFIDVSQEYFQGFDVKLEVKKQRGIPSKAAYICVFNNQQWIPVHYGFVKRNKVTFTAMHGGIVYLPVFYDGKDYIPAGDAFLLDTLGKVIPFLPHPVQKEKLVLDRKFHSIWMRSYWGTALNARFQGSNHPDFCTAADLYRIEQVPKYPFNTVEIEHPVPYRYIRYMGNTGTPCNVAELEFYAKENGQYLKLEGKAIGEEAVVEPGEERDKEAAFDGDILTYYQSKSGNGGWIGLDFGKKVKIDRIRYVLRNDDNFIRPGDLYELFYWADRKWNSLGQKTGDESYVLLYDNCPSGALFLLHNHTRGKEERIFTYENGKQVFW